ncbi:MAG: DSBA oxidoreductase [Candidatus Levybacteria bacterium GW2011_GWC2_37_7]|nr:MAG: DSBA oxidoreductase [Candidatus Levybacteria bacterium GW2011_GWC2_37_7]
MISSQAAYAAGLQGKFWEMHDMIFENQDSWSNTQARDIFIDYAKKLNLDSNKFESDMTSDATRKFITQEMNKAISLGINSTPTFFVNGKHIQNPAGYEAFKKIIQDELAN